VASSVTLDANITLTTGTLALNTALASINSVTSVAGQNLVLALGTGGTALTLTTSTLLATFAGSATVTGDLTVTGGNVGVGGAVDNAIGVKIVSAALSGVGQYSIFSEPVFASDATTFGAGLWTKVSTAAAAYTMTNGYGIIVRPPTVGAASAITTLTGVSIGNQGATGITNAYGIDIAAQSGAATTNVGLRNAGTTLLTNATEVGAGTGALVVSGGVYVTKAVSIASTTASTSTTTGALIVAGGLGVVGAINAASINGNVTLGASGPQLSSSIVARAPSQGLVFDGSAVSGLGTLGSAIGTTDATTYIVFKVPASNPSADMCLYRIGLTGTSGDFGETAQFLRTDGAFWFFQRSASNTGYRKAYIANFVTSHAGKIVSVAVTRTGATLLIYVNGVSTAFVEADVGTAPPSFDLAWQGTYLGIGKYGSSTEQWTGYTSGLMLWNRLLTSTEVLSLYESGAPAGADYGGCYGLREQYQYAHRCPAAV
jgi:hypothetical protein